MHRFSTHPNRFRRYLSRGIVGVCCGVAVVSCSVNDAAQQPDELAYNPQTVETVKQLWMDVDAPETLANCYTNVLKEAGALSEPIETMSELAAAHESLSETQQKELDDCVNIVNSENPPE